MKKVAHNEKRKDNGLIYKKDNELEYYVTPIVNTNETWVGIKF